MLTEKQKKVCEKYSARDKEGFVHCNECPLVVDKWGHVCRAVAHYDRRRREWIFDWEGDKNEDSGTKA